MSEFALYQGDCLEVLRGMADNSVDAVVTDPPYGIALDTDYRRYGSKTSYAKITGDGVASLAQDVFRVAPLQVIFGANNFYWLLPPIAQAGWLCWDKRCCEKADKVFGSPFEMAWVSRQKFFRIYRIQHGGAINADGANQPRHHPTQKPVALMRRIILDLTKVGDTIIDPYMGSGTTGVACAQTGRNFIGVEIDPTYFAVAEKRIDEARQVQRLPMMEAI